MGKTYDQLDIDERYEICRLREAGVSLRGIGRMMGRSGARRRLKRVVIKP